MTRLQKSLPWLLGILVASLVMGALALFVGLEFTGNDDTAILRATMGYAGGEPTTYLQYSHTILTLLLYGLAKVFPGAAWFSILQIFLLWFSQAVIIKSLCQMTEQKGVHIAAGAAIGALFIAVFALYISARITYTATAALCGAAAVFSLFAVDFTADSKEVLRGVLGSAALLMACYSLRMSAALPAACFFLLVFGFKLLQARPKSALKALLIAGIAFAVFAGITLLRTGAQDVKSDTQWHAARTQLFDYTGFAQDIPDETVKTIGWSRDELALVQNWFFLNDNITAAAFQTLIDQQTAAAQAEPGVGLLLSAWTTVVSVISDEKLYLALWCLLLAAIAVALRGTRHTWLLLIGALLGAAAMLLLLGAMGRLNARAAYTVLLPAGAAVFAAFFSAGGIPGRQWAATAMSVCLAVSTILMVVAAVQQISDTYTAPNPYFTDTSSDLHADLDEIALMNEDRLIIYDLSLSHDHRMFPDTSEGIPQNLMLWGGWQAHTPVWRSTLANFGITALDASLFLRDDVLFASTYDQPPQEMMNYIAAATDQTVDWYYYDQWGYVNLFEFDAT